MGGPVVRINHAADVTSEPENEQQRWKENIRTHCEEDQDVALRRSDVDLEHGCDSGMNVVGFRLGRVSDFDGKTTTRN